MADKQEKDLQRVKDLIELMKANDLVEIEIVEGDSRMHLKRPGAVQAHAVYSAAPVPVAAAPAPAAPAAAAPAVQQDAGLLLIKSPIVGTFYQAASPDSPPYVKIGQKVDPDTAVCIIEAMKVMNEIKAELSGSIVEICCKDGQAVEFGQVLFKVRP